MTTTDKRAAVEQADAASEELADLLLDIEASLAHSEALPAELVARMAAELQRLLTALQALAAETEAADRAARRMQAAKVANEMHARRRGKGGR